MGERGTTEATISIKFTRKELWELMNVFSAGFEEGGEGNETANAISDKLAAAYNKRPKPTPTDRPIE